MAEGHQTATFPDIGFSMPGELAERTLHGIVTEDAWGRYALLTGIGPADASAPAGDQAFSAFEGVAHELESVGMDFSHVVRTWLYADRILDWYGELNKARDRFFRERGVYGRYVPVSTGIGWSGDSSARILLGAFAAQAKEPGSVVVEALPSPLQCPALEYGSSFSRAAEVRTPGWRRVIVSGTASLAPGSHEVAHVGDVARQIDCAMKAVAAIYMSRGMSFGDVSGALTYLKDETCRPHWERWLAVHPEYPAAHTRAIVADVCRPEWLFEIESDATQWT